MKIFLSHSSADKDIVGKVFAELGSAVSHYDVETFDNTGFLPDQIYEALLESDCFVLFASKAALQSKWVGGELRTAFSNWMKSGSRDAMVFLLRDGTIDDIPAWLRAYVVIEHPSPAHITCRIKSRFEEEVRSAGVSPPFYRYDDLTKLEKSISVTTEKMPKAVLLCAADGYGKKQLANELYNRHFHGVAKFKISLSLDNSSSDFDLYRAVIGSFSLLTISELSERLDEFKSLSADGRAELLAKEILHACGGNQALIIDSKESLLDEAGELNSWLISLLRALPRSPYPKLILLSSRKPTYITGDIVDQVVVTQLTPLPSETSKLLFQWWLRRLDVPEVEFVMEQLLEYIEGSQKQIELAARLVGNLAIPKGLVANRHRIFSDLEKQATVLLKDMQNDRTSVLVLAFIAECGFISEADLLKAFEGIEGLSVDQITKAVTRLISYGFVVDDEVSLHLPGFLLRAARRLSDANDIAALIRRVWSRFIEIFDEIEIDSRTSISFLNEACTARLRGGDNKMSIMDNIILPSQCFRVARIYYDGNQHQKALDLCKKAYEKRIALTEEAAIEVLRIQGLSAARLNDQSEFGRAIASFSEHRGGMKPRRIKEFLLGFEARLAGKFDLAIKHLTQAYNAKGGGDYHIIRELAFLYWSQDDFEKAKAFLKQLKPHALLNRFVLEIRVRNAIALGEGYVLHNNEEILRMIEELDAMELPPKKSAFVARVEYELAVKRVDSARQMLEDYEISGAPLGQSIRILKTKVFIAAHRFGQARALALSLKVEIEKENRKQRQSALPVVLRYLIEASAGVSLTEGIEEYRRNSSKLPQKIAEKLRKSLHEAAAYSQENLTPQQRRILEPNVQ
jgi:tetratricopeptide (TPR) repeat protein